MRIPRGANTGPAPGLSAHYRVYVITVTGNESDSNTVTRLWGVDG